MFDLLIVETRVEMLTFLNFPLQGRLVDSDSKVIQRFQNNFSIQ